MSEIPCALDLFCGAGGVSTGLHRAGFDVIGIDVQPMPRYPFAFVQADALRPPVDLSRFDLIWASPPCQAYSHSAHYRRSQGAEYPDLVGRVRDMLELTGVPYIIENVPGAPVRADLILDGTMFDETKVIRKRFFELGGWFTLGPPSKVTPGLVSFGGYSCVVGHGRPSGVAKSANAWHTIAAMRKAMGIDWMKRSELTQAIPPAYSQFIGEQFLSWRVAA